MWKMILRVFGILVILLLVGLAGWGYSRWRLQQNNPEVALERTYSDFTIRKPLIKEVRWSNGNMKVTTRGIEYLLELVTDGILLTQPYQIITKDVEVLATTRVSIRGFYLDGSNNRQSVVIPQLVELPIN